MPDETTTLITSFSSADGDTSTTTATTATETPFETPESIPKSNFQGFNVISLLPLFIILGVLLLATFVGWTYGRCVRCCQRRREPVPGGPHIGGRPYEFGGYDSDTIGPMRSAGVGWVDASRIHEQHDSATVAYHAIRTGRRDEEPGTPSKSKARTSNTGGWFRNTFSRRKRPNENSPSGEKGLNHSANGMQTRRIPLVSTSGRSKSQGISPSSSNLESPKLLRIVNGSPSTQGNGAQSPATSAQPTPYISASRHGSLRRKLVEKVQAEDEEYLLAASRIPGSFQKFEDADEQPDNWAGFKADPLRRSPARRFTSGNSTSKSPRSLTRSPDPQEHRARMRRLRAAALTNAAASDAISPLQSPEAGHPLPPTPEVLLSPPLQPHLFFTGLGHGGSSSKGVSPPFAPLNRSRDLSEQTEASSSDDPFGQCNTPSMQPMQRTRARKKPLERAESTKTVPLSPELRDAAMTRFEEIVKTNWSMRNLAEVPRSPTLFGALSPSLNHGFYEEDKGHQAGIEDTLLTDRPGSRGQTPE
ncbi:hypothetical protein FRC07_006724 [Ceratobasidium sp. 392]|nr:hypothetical protein FRC07_006724 [Ceratobasidium sp. 392]